jgi:glycosyltransferase involved in cell wall biosynthesis
MLLPKKSIVTTNMDGLEWKRTKFSKAVQNFLLEGERLAVLYSNFLISDSIGIQDYLKEKYGKDSTFIPYGAYEFTAADPASLAAYDLEPYGYNMLVARLEPENSIEPILDGVSEADVKVPFIVVGKHQTKYGEYLKSKFQQHAHIRFVGGIYDIHILNNVRYFSNVYFHGHTVGGTNPSLLEAMASHSLICANNNPFNRYVLQEDALYFDTAADVTAIIQSTHKEGGKYNQKIENNLEKIRTLYNWNKIIDQYAAHFHQIISIRNNERAVLAI